MKLEFTGCLVQENLLGHRPLLLQPLLFICLQLSSSSFSSCWAVVQQTTASFEFLRGQRSFPSCLSAGTVAKRYMEALRVCYPAPKLDSASAWTLKSSEFEYFSQVIFRG